MNKLTFCAIKVYKKIYKNVFDTLIIVKRNVHDVLLLYLNDNIAINIFTYGFIKCSSHQY